MHVPIEPSSIGGNNDEVKHSALYMNNEFQQMMFSILKKKEQTHVELCVLVLLSPKTRQYQVP
jgi:hypothetical protein